MAGRLERGGRVAAAALLTLGSVAPLNGPLLAASVAPVAAASTACAVTVGTATTDPALAANAARAIAAGYATTDCLPDAALLAAAEARAAIPMGTPPTTPPVAVASPPGGTTSSGSVAVARATTTTPTPAPAALPTTSTATSTPTPATAGTTTGTTATGSTANDDGSSSTGSSSTGSSSDRSDSGTGADDADDPGVVTDGSAADGTSTAAGRLGWGAATGVEDFEGDLTNWSVYDGPGHAGNGRRSPSAMSVSGGIVTITGDADGTTGGMAWKQGRSQYGRWEARVRSPAADPSYNAVMLLWPDAENWPVGGEVDFMEIGDETRQEVDFFLHYGADNDQLHGQVKIDATRWHNWAVEWTPTSITAYVDGNEWFSTTQASALPPGPMHLTLQLDWFPQGGSVQQSAMHVDWVRYYPIDGSGAGDPIVNSADTTSAGGASLPGATGAAAGGTGGNDTGGGDAVDDRHGSNPQGDENAPAPVVTSVAGATASATTTTTPSASTAGVARSTEENPADGTPTGDPEGTGAP